MASMGSGSYFLKSYIDKTYREGMSKREAIEFAKEAVSLACFRDGSSGGCIRLLDITEDKLERHFITHTEKDIR